MIILYNYWRGREREEGREGGRERERKREGERERRYNRSTCIFIIYLLFKCISNISQTSS